MANGILKWFNAAKGSGFIEQKDGLDVFSYHYAITATGFKSQNDGDRAILEIKQPSRDPAASEVTVV